MTDGMRKPCPFCGNAESTVKRVWKNYWFVACNKCKAGGPVMKTTQEAEDAWNSRFDSTVKRYPILWCPSCGESIKSKGAMSDFCPSCGVKMIESKR